MAYPKLPDNIKFSCGLKAVKVNETMDGSDGYYRVVISGWGDPIVKISANDARDGLDYHGPLVRETKDFSPV